MKKRKMWYVGTMILSLALASMIGMAGAESPADFFKGKNVDYTLPIRPGSSINLIGRAAAPFMDKMIGTTSIFTNRMSAGGVQGYNWIYRAKPDGLTMGPGTEYSYALNKINDLPSAKYELDKFGYLMGVGKENMAFFVAKKGPYQTIADLKKAGKLNIASSSAAGSFTMGGCSVIHYLDLDAKVIPGFKGPAGVTLSVEQGETAGAAMSTSAAIPYLDRLKPLFVHGTKRLSMWPDVPSITELVEIKGEKLRIAEMWDNLSGTYTILLPPGVPEDRMQFLRDTYDKIMANPEFREKVNKIVGYKCDFYISGDEMHKKVTNLNSRLVEYKPLIKTLFKKYRR